MSDSDSVGSPGRQRRSVEKSRENIREYVKLLGKRGQDSPSPGRGSPHSWQDRSPMGSSSRSLKDEERRENTPSPSRYKEEVRDFEMSSSKARRSLPIGKLSPKEVNPSPSAASKKDLPVLPLEKNMDESSKAYTKKLRGRSEDKRISERSGSASSNSDSPRRQADSTPNSKGKGTKITKVNKKSSGESKKGSSKQEKDDESSDDSIPDLVLFLKEGRGRNQNWSEPPTLDAETIATRSRTRVPTEEDLEMQKKSHTSDNVKSKGKKDLKKAKKKKLEVLETPESLKRLAQDMTSKSQKKNVPHDEKNSKDASASKGDLKGGPSENLIRKSRKENQENRNEERRKTRTRTKSLPDGSESSSFSDTSFSDRSSESSPASSKEVSIKKTEVKEFTLSKKVASSKEIRTKEPGAREFAQSKKTACSKISTKETETKEFIQSKKAAGSKISTKETETKELVQSKKDASSKEINNIERGTKEIAQGNKVASSKEIITKETKTKESTPSKKVGSSKEISTKETEAKFSPNKKVSSLKEIDTKETETKEFTQSKKVASSKEVSTKETGTKEFTQSKIVVSSKEVSTKDTETKEFTQGKKVANSEVIRDKDTETKEYTQTKKVGKLKARQSDVDKGHDSKSISLKGKEVSAGDTPESERKPRKGERKTVKSSETKSPLPEKSANEKTWKISVSPQSKRMAEEKASQTKAAELQSSPKASNKPIKDKESKIIDKRVVYKDDQTQMDSSEDQSRKKIEMDVPKNIAKPLSSSTETEPSGNQISPSPSISSFMEEKAKSPCLSPSKRKDSTMSLKDSNLVTVAASSTGKGSQVRYRKIHIKIPTVSPPATIEMHNPSFIGSARNDFVSQSKQKPRNEKDKSNAETSKNDESLESSELDLSLRLSSSSESGSAKPPSEKKSPSNLSQRDACLYDFTDIEAEEVIIDDKGLSSGSPDASCSDKDPETSMVVDQTSPQVSQEVDLYSSEVLESSGEEDGPALKLPESPSSFKKNLMLSPEGRVALDHSYSSGSSEGSKGSSQKKRSPATTEKSVATRPVYSSATLAKRSLDIMMHNDKINILRQMSQIFNNEKPSCDKDERGEGSGASCSTNDPGVTTKTKSPAKGDSPKNKGSKDLDKQTDVATSTSYIFTPEKSSLNSPSKVLLVKPSFSHIKDLQKESDSVPAEDANQLAKKESSTPDKEKTIKRAKDLDFKKDEASHVAKKDLSTPDKEKTVKRAKDQESKNHEVNLLAKRNLHVSDKQETIRQTKYQDSTNDDESQSSKRDLNMVGKEKTIKRIKDQDSNKDRATAELLKEVDQRDINRQGKLGVKDSEKAVISKSSLLSYELKSDDNEEVASESQKIKKITCGPEKTKIGSKTSDMEADKSGHLSSSNTQKDHKEPFRLDKDDKVQEKVDDIPEKDIYKPKSVSDISKTVSEEKNNDRIIQSTISKESCGQDLSGESFLNRNRYDKTDLSEDKEASKTDLLLENSRVLNSGIKEKDSNEQEDQAVDDIHHIDEPSFLGFPDRAARVHRVSSYSNQPEENIKVESRIGPRGEDISVVDGFTFVSFDTQEEMMTYSKLEGIRKLKRLRKKRRKKRKLTRVKTHIALVQNAPSSSTTTHLMERGTENQGLLVTTDSAEQSSAFASNDLDAFLDNCSKLNISYAIPKCKATEDGVTRINDMVVEDRDKADQPSQLQDSQPVMANAVGTPIEEHPAEGQADDHVSDPIQQYEEVNAMDILYPKEKYKYYYNKELRKETKADGSTVFVRRAGKLVPLNSVFKSQRGSSSQPAPKKTVELVYVYDGGKLLTLGGSLTKINPSNSDSVRARVALPLGTPLIAKGQVLNSGKKQVNVVEINEDMAEYALSALQDPVGKENKSKEDPSEASVSQSTLPSPEYLPEKKSISKESTKDNKTTPKNWSVTSVKPTKNWSASSVKPTKNWSVSSVKPTKTNILDIIAAKLAMSEDESDEKEEEEKGAKQTEKEHLDEKETKSKPTDEIGQDTKEDGKDEHSSKDKEKDIKDPHENVLSTKEEEKVNTDKESSSCENQVPEDVANIKEEEEKESNKVLPFANGKREIKEDGTSGEVSEDKNLIKDSELELKGSVALAKEEQKDSKSILDQVKDQVTTEGEIAKSHPGLLGEKDEVKEESLKKDPSQSSQSEVGEKTDCKKEEESNSDAGESEDKSSSSSLSFNIESSKQKIFKKNMYRFPSLSREMKRLNMNFVKYVGDTSEEPSDPVKPDTQAPCTNEFCKLGCLCETLACPKRGPEHCGRIECMFECTCRDESWKHPTSGSGRTMNAVSIFNLDREQMEGLAVREKDFKRTVIQTGSEVILVGAERKKRERRMPDRYRDSDVWDDSNMATSPDPDAARFVGDYPGIPISEAFRYTRKCSVNIPWYDITGISVWCMYHSCYDCKCFTDPTYRSSGDADLLDDAQYDMLMQDAKSSPLPPAPTKEDVPPHVLEPSCVIVNIDVNNVDSRRRYCWRLKEWYHPVDFHSSRTCGYSSSKKRILEETKKLTLSGQSRNDSPEQLVEDVVRNLRYEKSKEYSQGMPPSDFETIGGMSPPNLKKIVNSNKGNYSESAKGGVIGSVPVVDLTSELRENQRASSNRSPRMSHNQPESEERIKKRSHLSENTDPQAIKRRRVSDPGVGSADPRTNHLSGRNVNQQRQSHGTSSIREDLKRMGHSAGRVEPAGGVEPAGRVEPASSGGERSEDKEGQPIGQRKPLSLVEMMMAEENRGELELDLSNRIPGNALLVAEGRFRKLIIMNIIGIVGINKAGRCIISTVDSAQCLRTMQRIHNMISTNTLDVGPNMREIFFPPSHASSRHRFVMIRCDVQRKWEIVGVVQKKGTVGQATKKWQEQKTNKPLGSQRPPNPQVIDLDEEDAEKKGSVDSQKEITPADEFESCIEKSCWEGSLPQIASVQGGSDVHPPDMTEFPTTEENSVNQSEMLSTSSTKTDSNPFISLPNLSAFPVSGSSKNSEVGSAEVQPIETIETLENSSGENLFPGFVSSVSNAVTEEQSRHYVPTSFTCTTTTTVTASLSPSPIATTGMKKFKLNQMSHKVFGDSSANSIASVSPSSYASSLAAGSGTVPVHKGTPVIPKFPAVFPPTTGASSSDFEKININQVKDKGSVASGPDQKPLEGSMGVPPVSQSGTSVHKGVSMPATSGGKSKLMYLPPGKGHPHHMVMMAPPPGSENKDAPLKKMLLVPSTSESGKMVLIPVPMSFGNAPQGRSTNDGKDSVNTVSSSQHMRVSSKIQPSTSGVQQSTHGDLQSPPMSKPLPPLLEIDVKNSTEQKIVGKVDDVIMLDSPLNSESISKVNSLSEESEKNTSPNVSYRTGATTTVVSSSSTVSSTLYPAPLPSAESTSKASDCDASDISRPSKKVRTEGENGNKENVTHKSSKEAIAGDSPVIEYEAITSAPSDKAKSGVCIDSEKANKVESASDFGTDEIQEVEVTTSQIKKGGHHWSAVDLSLTFKSVKLEWLLGTIRKNVLLNIYRMSQKTQSPVTLSVKNGTCMSMLYGMARKSYFDSSEQKFLPVLILGSVMSAVMNSNSTQDSSLFKSNAIKYFIREDTGELASYTYDEGGLNLIKLASKKRDADGEMVGIGETIALHSVRDSKYIDKSQAPSAPRTTDANMPSRNNSCGCIPSRNVICRLHSTTRSDGISNSSTSGSASTCSNLAVPVTREYSLPADSAKDSVVSKSSAGIENPNEFGFIPQIEKVSGGVDRQLFQAPPVNREMEDQPANQDCEILCEKKPSKSVGLPPPPPLLHMRDPSQVPQKITQTSTAKDHAVVENEDIDVEGECDETSIVTSLRDQMMVLYQTADGKKIQKPVEGRKDHKYVRPCPLSKKPTEKLPQMKRSSTLFPARKDNDPNPMVQPRHLALWKHTGGQNSPASSVQKSPAGSVQKSPASSIEDSPAGPSGVKIRIKPKPRRPSVKKIQKKHEPKFVDVEGLEERSTFVHNELERARRRALRHLFLNLASELHLCEKDSPSVNDYKSQPKVLILRKAKEIIVDLHKNSLDLGVTESKCRRERSALIHRLGAAIRDKSEDTKTEWKNWVKENMENPTAKETFETSWKPTDMEQEIMALSINETMLDMDTDEGSTPSAPSSPVPSASSTYQQSPPKTYVQHSTVASLTPTTVDTSTLNERVLPGSVMSEDTFDPQGGTSSRAHMLMGQEESSSVSYPNSQSGLQTKEYPRPPYSYGCLIALAINNSKHGNLTVTEIYKFVRSFFPYFRTANKNWQNGIRHSLSLSKSFRKIEPDKQSVTQGGRAKCKWTVDKINITRVNNLIEKCNQLRTDDLAKSMEFPEFITHLQNNTLNVEYSSCDDDEDDDESDGPNNVHSQNPPRNTSMENPISKNPPRNISMGNPISVNPLGSSFVEIPTSVSHQRISGVGSQTLRIPTRDDLMGIQASVMSFDDSDDDPITVHSHSVGNSISKNPPRNISTGNPVSVIPLDSSIVKISTSVSHPRRISAVGNQTLRIPIRDGVTGNQASVRPLKIQNNTIMSFPVTRVDETQKPEFISPVTSVSSDKSTASSLVDDPEIICLE